MAVLMLWTAPAAQYWIEAHRGNFSNLVMQVDAATYFRVAIPGVLAICWAYYLPFPLKNRAVIEREALVRTLAQVHTRPKGWLGLGILALGMLWMYPMFPASMRFLGFLGRSLWYVLAILLLLDKRIPYRYVGLAVMFGLLLLDSLRTTMFGEMATVLLLMVIYGIFYHRYALWKLLAGELILMLGLCFLISFKYDYRGASKTATTWGEKIGLFTQLAGHRLAHPFDPYVADIIVARLGQGANMSLVLKHVPAKQPFVQGATIRDAFWGALLPRFLWPDKPKAGGAENVRQFMGIEHLNYSINIGVVGEAYVNYGVDGRFVLFLVAYLLLFRVLYELAIAYLPFAPALVLFLPIVFFTVISVEKDVLTILNHVVKAGLVAGFVLTVWQFWKSRTGTVSL